MNHFTCTSNIEIKSYGFFVFAASVSAAWWQVLVVGWSIDGLSLGWWSILVVGPGWRSVLVGWRSILVRWRSILVRWWSTWWAVLVWWDVSVAGYRRFSQYNRQRCQYEYSDLRNKINNKMFCPWEIVLRIRVWVGDFVNLHPTGSVY